MFSALRTPLWLYLNPARHHIWGKDDKQTVLQSRSSLDQFLHIFFPPFFYLEVKQLIKIIYFCYSKIKGEKEAQDTFKKKKNYFIISVCHLLFFDVSHVSGRALVFLKFLQNFKIVGYLLLSCSLFPNKMTGYIVMGSTRDRALLSLPKCTRLQDCLIL